MKTYDEDIMTVIKAQKNISARDIMEWPVEDAFVYFYDHDPENWILKIGSGVWATIEHMKKVKREYEQEKREIDNLAFIDDILEAVSRMTPEQKEWLRKMIKSYPQCEE